MVVILAVCVFALIKVRYLSSEQFQDRNVSSFHIAGYAVLWLAVWWIFFSRAFWRLRLVIVAVFLGLAGSLTAAFRIRGVTGDFMPVIETRWARRVTSPPAVGQPAVNLSSSDRPDFPQYLGPDRNGIIGGTAKLASDWERQPPQELWRQPIGPAWSGFAIVGNRAVTLEQRDDKEAVICLDVLTGRLLWEHVDLARFTNPLAGEGPRSTPSIVDGRVYTLGATGLLNCLALETGAPLWQRQMSTEAPQGLPEFGYASSPLVYDGKVFVCTGQTDGGSLFAYGVANGELIWRAGLRATSYSSPTLMTLGNVPQIVSFNMRFITAHDPTTGKVLWEAPWGRGQPQIAQPVVVGQDRLVFSSGYGVGCEMFQIKRGVDGQFSAERIWKTLNLKAKISNFVHRDGFLYGLDDGILTCLDVRDGSRRWKAGRYGHGQFLLLGDLMLLVAENGELWLLAPTPDAPNERTRFRVFNAKCWNPPALSGNILLLRTDREAACFRVPFASR